MSAPATAHQPGAVEGRPRSTHFTFEHKVFGLEGAHFALTSDTREAAFHLLLGDLHVAILLPTLYQEFDIKPDSSDAELLGVIERSLRYVKEIRPNDSIPREILDGTASWSVEDRHRLIAKGWLSLQIASWLTGEQVVSVDRNALERLAEDPLTKQKVDEAFGAIADKLEIGRARRQEVVDRIDDLARELSFIEALRERSSCVKDLVNKLNQLVRAYRKDDSITQEISRVRALLLKPRQEFDALFAQSDAMTGDIVAVLKNFDTQVELVRDMRDQLHTKLMLWDDVIEVWKAIEPVRGEKSERAVKETYRFAARHFPQRQDWKLGGH